MQVSMQVVRQALFLEALFPEALPLEALPLEALPLEALPLDVRGDNSATMVQLPRVVSDSSVGSDASGGRAELERKTL
jgi:hypothetical protein